MLNIRSLPWPEIHEALDRDGFARTGPVLTPQECEDLRALYDDGAFRSTIHMARHRFGEGEYKYFDNPLPDTVAQLREGLYPELAQAANRWAGYLGDDGYPDTLDEFLATCHAAGQTRPTPLILRYREGGYNALHQDLYGDVAFPFQALTVLSRKGEDFEGGESVLIEQRPRQQSRAHVISLNQGELLFFPTRHRPAAGSKGYYRATLRHGVATLTRGERLGLGVIFHDAR
jgi:uncharacterized protein